MSKERYGIEVYFRMRDGTLEKQESMSTPTPPIQPEIDTWATKIIYRTAQTAYMGQWEGSEYVWTELPAEVSPND